MATPVAADARQQGQDPRGPTKIPRHIGRAAIIRSQVRVDTGPHSIAMSTVSLGWSLAILLAALTVVAALVTRLSALGRARQPISAAVRAVVQLAAVSTIIGAVLHSLGWTLLFLAGMVLVAGGTSAQRVTGAFRPAGWWCLLPIIAGVTPTMAMILLSTAVPFEPTAILPTAGILIGGAMTATTLAARRMGEELTSQRGAYEAGLSLGLTRRSSAILIARDAAALALVPGLDQTRTVGLVSLPGAFVGVLLAGASPWQAGAAQVLVLISLLLVQAVAVTVTIELIGSGKLPATPTPLPA
jgi:putative ABC transport system permease protein